MPSRPLGEDEAESVGQLRRPLLRGDGAEVSGIVSLEEPQDALCGGAARDLAVATESVRIQCPDNDFTCRRVGGEG